MDFLACSVSETQTVPGHASASFVLQPESAATANNNGRLYYGKITAYGISRLTNQRLSITRASNQVRAEQHA